MKVAKLQWGRSGEGAEDEAGRGGEDSAGDRFNGAAPVKERKTIQSSHSGA